MSADAAPRATWARAPGPVLREARWTDVAALVALEGEIFPDDAWSEPSWWAELGGRPRRDYVVLEDALGIAGYAGLDHAGEVSDVMTVAVAPRARGRGLGRVLVEELEGRAARRGAGHVLLEVRADNTAALALYSSRGFTEIARRRGYYQPGGVDAVVLRLSLSENGSDDD